MSFIALLAFIKKMQVWSTSGSSTLASGTNIFMNTDFLFILGCMVENFRVFLYSIRSL